MAGTLLRASGTEWITTGLGPLENEDDWTFEHLEELIADGSMALLAFVPQGPAHPGPRGS